MKLIFEVSGGTIFVGEADCVPPVGSLVRFVSTHRRKGNPPGVFMTATVVDDNPPFYDFSNGMVTVTLDIEDIAPIRLMPHETDDHKKATAKTVT